jgi:hypothetical protein
MMNGLSWTQGANGDCNIPRVKRKHEPGAGEIAAERGMGDNAAWTLMAMPNTLHLFRLINDFIFLLLGGFLILLAVTRPVMLPARPMALVLLGVFLMYWGVRAWIKPEPGAAKAQTIARAASLLLVGLLVAIIPEMPLRDSGMLLGAAGCVLVLRGLAGIFQFVRVL